MAVSLDIADLRARRERPASTMAPAALPAEAVNLAATKTDGLGCRGVRQGRDAGVPPKPPARCRRRCNATLRQDYPQGPHDQPQSMCPAFGSLRVGLRMRRTATDPVGLGLLRLRADLHLAFLRAPSAAWATCPSIPRPWSPASCSRTSARRCSRRPDPTDYDAVVVINLCVPTASGVPLRLLPKGDQRCPDHRHRRAGLRRADPCGSQGRARAGPC